MKDIYCNLLNPDRVIHIYPPLEDFLQIKPLDREVIIKMVFPTHQNKN